MKSYLMYKVETEQRDYYFFADEFGNQEKELFNTLALLKSQKIGFDFYVYECIDDDEGETSKRILYSEKFRG